MIRPANIRPRRARSLVAVLVAIAPLWHGCVAARPDARQPLTFETVYGPQRVNFSGSYARGLSWRPDGEFYEERRDGVLFRVRAADGTAEPAYDLAALTDALTAHPDFDIVTARHLARYPTLLSPDRQLAVLEHASRLYFYRFANAELVSLAGPQAGRRDLTLSPDQAYVAFTRDHDLYTLRLADGLETRLTHDGSDVLLNGVLDWVYQEEVFGRGQWRSYWWSDDGRYIAFLQLDESDVPRYPLIDYLSTHPDDRSFAYPKAGDPNPRARLGIVRPDDDDIVWIDLSAYDPADTLIVAVGWAPDGRLVFCTQQRESLWLDLCDADPLTGTSRRLLRETTPAWVRSHGLPHWRADGSFLWCSERDGWRHVYHYTRDGDFVRRLTTGTWEANRILCVDEQRGWLYVSGNLDSPVETHACRVPLAGGPPVRLTTPGFSHDVAFAPSGQGFLDTFSNTTTPPQVALRAADGELVRMISTNNVRALQQYRWTPPALLRVPTGYGHALNGLLIRPPTPPRPGQKLPVMVFTYAGPDAPSVHNRWLGRDFADYQLLAQDGYLVWVIDPYSASGEGAVCAWHCYQRLGQTELADIAASLHWLAAHEHADLSRVGIEGHSYGGFMVAYALTHSTLFKLGIAGSAVTDWANYDSIYTEAFMRTPAANPAGYAASSVVAAAGKLHGRLLLVHGALDDNVHVQNALQLADALLRAGKDFDLVIYPRDGHGFHNYARHWRRLRYDFIRDNL